TCRGSRPPADFHSFPTRRSSDLERLRPLTLIGVALALLAIILVSRPASTQKVDADSTRRCFPPGFGLALLSGIFVGIFFLSLARSEDHTSDLPSLAYLVCRLLLE